MSGNKEPRERKGMTVKEPKCGWPSVYETKRLNAFCDISFEGFVKSTFQTQAMRD